MNNEINNIEEKVFLIGFIQTIYSIFNSWLFYIYCWEKRNIPESLYFKKISNQDYFRKIDLTHGRYQANWIKKDIYNFPYSFFSEHEIGFDKKEKLVFIFYAKNPYGKDEKDFKKYFFCCLEESNFNYFFRGSKFDVKKQIDFFLNHKNKKYREISESFKAIKKERNKIIHIPYTEKYNIFPEVTISFLMKFLTFLKKEINNLFSFVIEEVDLIVPLINKANKGNSFETWWNEFKNT